MKPEGRLGLPIPLQELRYKTSSVPSKLEALKAMGIVCTIQKKHNFLYKAYVASKDPGPATACRHPTLCACQLLAVSGSMTCGISVIEVTGMPDSSECLRIASSLSAR